MNSINPYDALPDILHNCPNCGGTLQDDGKCRFCGSVVYDFVGIDMDNHTPIFIRMRHNGRIVHFKAIINSMNLNLFSNDTCLYYDNKPMYIRAPEWTGDVDFMIVSSIIVEDTEITGG